MSDLALLDQCHSGAKSILGWIRRAYWLACGPERHILWHSTEGRARAIGEFREMMQELAKAMAEAESYCRIKDRILLARCRHAGYRDSAPVHLCGVIADDAHAALMELFSRFRKQPLPIPLGELDNLTERHVTCFYDCIAILVRTTGGEQFAEDLNRLEVRLDREFCIDRQLAAEEQPPSSQEPTERDVSCVKEKRSTRKGDAEAKILGALNKHHEYSNGSVLKAEPIGVSQLARLADVSKASVSRFFKKKFESHQRYGCRCRTGSLATSLKFMNGEFTHCDTYGKTPRNEREYRVDDE